MIGQIGQDQTIMLLQKSLDSYALRHQVISNNIANAQTPGFKASDINFKNEVKKLMDKKHDREDNLELSVTNEKHINQGSINLEALNPEIIKISDTSMQPDGNNVDIDREMSTLAQNSIEFRASSRAMGDMLSIISMAIRGD